MTIDNSANQQNVAVERERGGATHYEMSVRSGYALVNGLIRIWWLTLAPVIAFSASATAQSTQEGGSQPPLMDRQKEIALARNRMERSFIEQRVNACDSVS